MTRFARHPSTDATGPPRAPLAFWPAALCVALALLGGLSLDGPIVTASAAAALLVGGLPHGAYDIALLDRSLRPGLGSRAIAVALYVVLVGAMMIAWSFAPLVALLLFLAVAAVHFGEDWSGVLPPAHRLAAGVAVLAAPALGHPTAVTDLFVGMSGTARAEVITQVLRVIAPVALLATLAGAVWTGWRRAPAFVAASVAALALLVAAPPVMGFALFFVCLHSPHHMAATRASLPGLSRARWILVGGAMPLGVVAVWLLARPLRVHPAGLSLAGEAFQLLAAVAVPHLAFSWWVERHGAGHRPLPLARHV